MLKTINQIVVFLIELVMIVAFGCYGYSKGFNALTCLIFSGLMVTLCVTMWGVLAAPKSKRRLPMPYLAFFRCLMFLTAAFFLVELKFESLAIAIAVLAVITQILSYFSD